MEGKLGVVVVFVLVDWQPSKSKERTLPLLRCFSYRKESECVCNLIVLRDKQITLYKMHSGNATWRPRIESL